MKNRNTIYLVLFLLPAIVMITTFFVVPLIFLIATSMTNWTTGSFANIEFIGIENFKKLFGNSEYWQAVRNTFIWISAAVFIQVPICIVTAIILTQKPPFWKVFRTIYFFPHIVAQYTLAWMWLFIYKPDIGLMNAVLRWIGLDSLAANWLGSSKTALGALIFTWIFNIGYFALIFMSQIGTISFELYEAAIIDGAGEIKKAWYITIPLLKNTISIVVLLCVTLTFKTFEAPFVMTQGGPGTSTEILPLMMYKRLLGNSGAVSNTVGVTMVALGIIVVLLIRKLFKEEEGERC